MNKTIITKLKRAFTLYDDLLEFIPEKYLTQKIQNTPSNPLGHQLWCVVGARHSYTKALKAGAWQGFDCPLKTEETAFSKAVSEKLKTTADDLLDFLENNEEYLLDILLDLYEHEIQHHGQIIRYLYAFKLGVPESWKKRYNLD
ncbi:MAG: hypothetical protein DWP97_12045 [Calditrichaeota bacterium]|nr:MAG: hypothetical protein DWP97_12045 [Calditrichota bacterium]